MTSAFRASAWGQVGHDTIAYIAQDHLTAAASRAVRRILTPGVGLADVSNWADQVRSVRPTTSGWHFIDIPVRVPALTESDEWKYCPANGCVVSQITADFSALARPPADPVEASDPLRFLVHFVGDIHQPLHCANDGDRGGNDKIVLYRKPGSSHAAPTKVKLHALWDLLLEGENAENPRELATALEATIGDGQRRSWSAGNAADWAWESHEIARLLIYSELPPGPTDPEGMALPSDYYSTKMRAVVDTQLQKAGIRLAWVLNTIFKA
jgi:hypothetical protein